MLYIYKLKSLHCFKCLSYLFAAVVRKKEKLQGGGDPGGEQAKHKKMLEEMAEARARAEASPATARRLNEEAREARLAAAADPAAERRRLVNSLLYHPVKRALLALLVPALDGTDRLFAM